MRTKRFRFILISAMLKGNAGIIIGVCIAVNQTMIITLSYLNLLFAVIYFLAYLQNGNAFVISGLLAAVVFNWLSLRKTETGSLKWTVFDWLIGGITCCFAGYTTYSSVVLLTDAIGYNYYPASVTVLIGCGMVFGLTLIFQLYLALVKSIQKKSE